MSTDDYHSLVTVVILVISDYLTELVSDISLSSFLFALDASLFNLFYSMRSLYLFSLDITLS